ncbi:hypothetical protein Poly21_15370 [Allorhodopirellula heiligendammensis]|uniref:Uncharacterized protein n=1 Tax=Allorhodopirellula heiligendammensis TaxID=2714739 RepID=A0A5C6C5H6_9BACT|nr:hypothetical protein Poly21_15370 [Allorhodopirellula heiligendammensis]
MDATMTNLPRHAQLGQMITGYWILQAIYAAGKFNIADLLPMQISSMAIRCTSFMEGLANRRWRSVFLITLITSQVTPSRSATSFIVMRRVSCKACFPQPLV